MSENREPQVAQLNIGELLSAKRHQMRQSIDEVSAQIKLPKEVVRKIENNQFDEVGTPVYVRGYLGLYAKHLDLDVAYLIEQYNIQHPAEEIAIRPSLGNSYGEPRRQTKRHSKTVSFLVVILVVSALLYGYAIAERYWKANYSVAADTPVATDNTVPNVLDEVKAAENLADDVLSGDSINASTGLVKDIDLDLALLKDSETGDAEAENTAAPKAQAPAPVIALESVANAASANADEPEKVEQPKKAVNGKVRMAFNKECWVEILDADGKKLTARLYSPSKKLTVNGKTPLTLIIGIPESVASVSYNGSAIKLSDYKVGNIKYRLPK